MIKRKCPEVNVMNVLLIYDSEEFGRRLRKMREVANYRTQERRFNRDEESMMMRILNAQY